MLSPLLPPPAAPESLPPRRWRRALPWATLVALLLVAQSLLVWLTLGYESSRAQEQVDATATAAAGDIKQALGRDLQSLQALLWNNPSIPLWQQDAAALLRAHRELLRIERRDAQLEITESVDSPLHGSAFTQIHRDDIDLETELACTTARRQGSPSYSRSYFVPLPGGLGLEVMDVCIPIAGSGQNLGFMAATFALGRLLDETVGSEVKRVHELSFIEGDGTRLARAGLPRGAGAFIAERLVDLPGLSLQLRVDSSAGRPRLIPNLSTALVLGLSLALGGVVVLLARDVRKRAGAEAALAEALSFRKAMEDSLVTGLRARDPHGRITYVNPAFCEMVGFSATELVGQTTPPYWPPELTSEYTKRQQVRLAGTVPPREGYETVFMRRNGERFAVMIFEAPLVDGAGRHTGWMSAALDVSAQRKIEEVSRQQQERLQATARLATVGEMASLLSHELNQPLAAIASYAAGSLNLMNDTDGDGAETLALLRQASQRIAEQAERAGRVIKSVHDFVRRREQAREPVRADLLIDAVLPLVRLQARKSGTRIELDLPKPMPRVVCDRTMLEQVLLNLTRNAIQAMESHTPAAERELTIRVRPVDARWVAFGIVDRGTGVADEVAPRLFTPFFTTRPEGMGLGLSLCRTVIEQHGGLLVFENRFDAARRVIGAEFRFTLPADSKNTSP
ncbi:MULTISPECIES: PAS domain S-box protein [unclassified Rhizobacter]|uniref:PAS domain S-box protein n=1 Tax=unclassified Rhizobacter TaxID=2640088 RepID=UPI000AED0CA5|nr:MULTISPECIES: PAS domain S-box protein [unclassified Rhizobacter]